MEVAWNKLKNFKQDLIDDQRLNILRNKGKLEKHLKVVF